MFIRLKTYKKRKTTAVQIVENKRVNGKVVQRVVKHVGMASDEKELEELKRLAKYLLEELKTANTPTLPLLDAKELDKVKEREGVKEDSYRDEDYRVDIRDLEEEGRIIRGIHDVYGKLFEDLGFSRIFYNPARNRQSVEYFKQMVLSRIANPSSKRRSVMDLEESFGVRLNLDSVYKMMDKIDERSIERLNELAYRTTRKLFNEKIDVIFFDATTIYFESFKEDELRRNGYSKDFKFNEVQVLLALMVSREGLPIGYETYSGNVYEGHSLISAVKRIRERYEIGRVVFVADRGMLSRENIEELEKLKGYGIRYIMGARLRSLPRYLREEVLDKGRYRRVRDGMSIGTFEYRGKRLIVTYSSKRAEKDARDRERRIERLRKKLERSKNPKEYMSNYGYKRYLRVFGGDEVRVELDEEKILEDARWDGLHGVFTNDFEMGEEEVIHQYSNLWRVEESFRITKHDLRIRPVYHWKPSRVRAHIAICFAAFMLTRYLEYRVRLQYKKLSIEEIRRILISVQESVLVDKNRGIRYVIPSKAREEADKIYKIFSIRRQKTPYILKK